MLLIMLNLSAAFNMIDHPTLLSRLASVIGLLGRALDWFSCYLNKSVQSVLIERVKSSLWKMLFGIHRGLCWGPIL